MLDFNPRTKVAIDHSIPRTAIAVLASGGMQSSILVAHLTEQFAAVYPVYVATGMMRQRAELPRLRRFLAAIRGAQLARLSVVEMQQREISNEAQALIETAGAWCADNGIETLAACLDVNWQLDPQTSTAAQAGINVVSPFQGLSRASLLAFGKHLPLDLTFSCQRPIIKANQFPLHCGRCLKCMDRAAGFDGLRMTDRTTYDVGFDFSKKMFSITPATT